MPEAPPAALPPQHVAQQRAEDAAPSGDAARGGAGRWALVAAVVVAVFGILAAVEGPQSTGQATVNGLVSGTYFALGAIGLALVFGVLRLVNFAHGDMLTFGAYVALLFNVTLGLPIVPAVAIGVVAAAALAGASEIVIWRPMRAKRAGSFQLLLITIGLAFVIRNGIQIVAGGEPRKLNVDVTTAVNLVGGVRIGTTQLVVVIVGLVALVVVGVLLRATRIGKEMRALSDSVELAEISGIDTRRVIMFTWLVAGGLAGLAGVLSAAAVGVITPNFGFLLLLSLFAASVLGGIRSAYGALAGGLLLGLIEEWSTLFFDPRWKLLVGFVILLLALMLRPEGLLGRPTVA